jgi:hypothetical protein
MMRESVCTGRVTRGTDTESNVARVGGQVDSFVAAHPDALVLFAAGNDGDLDPPDGTVGSPATCKNCLAVGASQVRWPPSRRRLTGGLGPSTVPLAIYRAMHESLSAQALLTPGRLRLALVRAAPSAPLSAPHTAAHEGGSCAAC